jgi:hypothetical protein
MSPSRRRPKPPVSSPVGEAGKAIARQVLRRIWIGLVLALFVVPANDTDRTSVPPEVIQAIANEVFVEPPSWTTDAAGAMPLVSILIPGKLPPPDPRQRRPPCDPDLHVEMEKACWVPLDVKPCPAGKAVMHEGRCFAPAMRAERTPTTGEPRAPTVASPHP